MNRTALAVSSVCICLYTGTAVSAQSLPYTNACVLAANPTGGAMTIDIDLATGAFTVLPAQPSDNLAPLAVERNPIDGTLLVALDAGSVTQVMARQWHPTVQETLLGVVPGDAVELLVDGLGDVIVVTGGSSGTIYRMPRHTGTTLPVRNMPFASAAGAPYTLPWSTIVGTSGTTSTPANLANVALDDGTLSWGPIAFPGFTPSGITGLFDLPTAVPRQLLAHDDGSLSLYSWGTGGNPSAITTLPTLPTAGIAAMKSNDQYLGVLLGGSTNPYLYTFNPMLVFGNPLTLTTVAGPLPGTPIDYALTPQPQASVLGYGAPCGLAADLRIGTTLGPGPVIGNSGFGITLRQALPSQPAWLVAGFHEVQVPLPIGCSLGVNPVAVAVPWTDTAGNAMQPIPLPNDPGLIGLRLYCQWMQLEATVNAFMSSDIAVIEIG